MSEKKEWFESEDFWKNYGPIMFAEAHWQEASAIADRVMKLAALHKGDSVLDAGCGVGRISVELAALGLKVTGTDIIQAELDTAAESARDEGVEIDFIKADMRKWCRPAAFDCAVNLYTSFGYCDTIDEDMLYLKNMCDC
ncbi:MAG: methyltransferase domain-containing protein, partial [Treponema sp.]|nr:methyltransferase domain-containing protein [Treponema sp.]